MLIKPWAKIIGSVAAMIAAAAAAALVDKAIKKHQEKIELDSEKLPDEEPAEGGITVEGPQEEAAAPAEAPAAEVEAPAEAAPAETEPAEAEQPAEAPEETAAPAEEPAAPAEEASAPAEVEETADETPVAPVEETVAPAEEAAAPVEKAAEAAADEVAQTIAAGGPNPNPVLAGSEAVPTDADGKVDPSKICSPGDFANWDELGCQS